jgi:hypothetical protein
MDCEHWIEQLYSDQSLTDHLTRDDAERLLSWSESHLIECEIQAEGPRLVDSIRLLNRYVSEGEPFEDLFTALRTNFQFTTAAPPATPLTMDDANLEKFYPTAPPPEE